MKTPDHSDLVTEYLERVRTAAADLPPSELDELLANIAEHIAASVGELDHPNEATVRTLLDRLGDPAVIAAEARSQSGRAGQASLHNRPPAVSAASPGALEWGGVAMLGIGSYLLPVIGTVAGLIMISMSHWWSTRQKIGAVVLSLAGVIVVPLVGLTLFVARADTTGPQQPDPVVQLDSNAPAPQPSRSPR